MSETAILSRARKIANPFQAALQQHPHLAGSISIHTAGESLPTPGVSVSVVMGEQRLDHPGDCWDATVELTARRAPGDYAALDDDAAAMEYVTSNLMAGDPNISEMIMEEEVRASWGEQGKARTYAMEFPVFVKFT